MNILFTYSSNINPLQGGVQKVTQILSDFFSNKGHSVYFLSCQSSDESIPKQFVLINKVINSAQNIEYLKQLLDHNSIDIIVNQDGFNKALSKLLFTSAYNRIPIITVVHNSLLSALNNFTEVHAATIKKMRLRWLTPILKMRLTTLLLRILYKFKYKGHYLNVLEHSERLVLLATAYLDELEFFVGSKRMGNAMVMPNPCTIKCSDISLIEKKKIVLYVGRIHFAQKKNNLLLHIWSQIEPKNPEWKLQIVGAGEDYEALKNIQNDLKLNHVEFLGYQSPARYYEAASIFCLTSAFEGFPLSIIESMEYGCIPITFNSYGAAQDIINNDVDGYLIQPFKIDEYVNVLQSLIDNEEQRETMSKAAKYGAKKFNLESIGEQWLKMFESIIYESDR
jgi:glycosyltransferase involved in cell wall biosynthesis